VDVGPCCGKVGAYGVIESLRGIIALGDSELSKDGASITEITSRPLSTLFLYSDAASVML